MIQRNWEMDSAHVAAELRISAMQAAATSIEISDRVLGQIQQPRRERVERRTRRFPSRDALVDPIPVIHSNRTKIQFDRRFSQGSDE